jgi:hypothetical protein
LAGVNPSVSETTWIRRPRCINQAILRWDYSRGGAVELEWGAVGSYSMDAANTVKYDDHQVFSLRVK